MTGADTEPTAVVIVDDDQDHLALLRAAVESTTGRTGSFADVRTYREASEALANLPVDRQVVVLCDYCLADGTGLDWLPDFVRSDAGPVIIVTSMEDKTVVADSFRQGAADYIEKSAAIGDPERLHAAISEALRRFRLEKTNRDLSRRLKVANHQLRCKSEVLAALTETAHRLVEDVAHEFRTPLAVIQEFAAIMRDGIGGPVSDKQGEYLDFVTGASHDLANLVDDFLDIGKLRARTLRVDRREHAVEAIVDSCWSMLESRAAGRAVPLTRHVEPGLPTVFADADRARRTIINLAVNAIKFSSPGSPVRLTARADGRSGVRVEVTDHGTGMREEDVERLFGRFRQVGGADGGGCKGFGLGLSIVKDLVGVNLGSVHVESVLGQGSTFSFTLPRCEPASIVDACIQGVLARASKATLAALEVRPEEPGWTLEALRAHVASLSYPTDVQIPAPGGPGVVLVGECDNAERWKERLTRPQDDGAGRPRGGGPGRLTVRVLGAWPAAAARGPLLECLGSPVEAR